MQNRHKYGADGKKYQFKGGLFTSPEASDVCPLRHSSGPGVPVVECDGCTGLLPSSFRCALLFLAVRIRFIELGIQHRERDTRGRVRDFSTDAVPAVVDHCLD